MQLTSPGYTIGAIHSVYSGGPDPLHCPERPLQLPPCGEMMTTAPDVVPVGDFSWDGGSLHINFGEYCRNDHHQIYCANPIGTPCMADAGQDYKNCHVHPTGSQGRRLAENAIAKDLH